MYIGTDEMENLSCAAFSVQLILGVNSGKCYSAFKQLQEGSVARALNIKSAHSPNIHSENDILLAEQSGK